MDTTVEIYPEDTIFFVAFDGNKKGETTAQEFFNDFKKLFPELQVVKSSFEKFERWHYSVCYEIELKDKSQLLTIKDFIEKYCDDIEVISLCTKATLIERYNMIKEAHEMTKIVER